MLENLATEYYHLQFLVDTEDNNIRKEMEISLQAGELVGVLYNALLKQYKDPSDSEALKSLNMLCVRLVFCLYAEDAGIFVGHAKFHNYLARFEARDVRKALMALFLVLDKKPEDKDPYMDDELASFPYVNGGLFADERIIIPRFDEEIVSLLLQNASEDFNWSEISPTIFGAVFESTLNPETRRFRGMHYTSIENIHKVINPLFLNGLKEELERIQTIAVDRTRNKKLREFQVKLSKLAFLDITVPRLIQGFLPAFVRAFEKCENDSLSHTERGVQKEKMSTTLMYSVALTDCLFAFLIFLIFAVWLVGNRAFN